MMRKSNLLQRSLLILSLFSLQAYAGNYGINSVAVRAGTMQAFTAIADDGSALFYNPAGITQIPGTVIENIGLLIFPQQTYHNSNNGGFTYSDVNVVAPNTFFTTDYFKRVTVGVGIDAPFARETRNYPNQSVYGYDHLARMLRLDLTPSVAVKLHQNFSLGGGLVVSRFFAKNDVMGFYENGKAWGTTGQIGALLTYPEHLRFGLTYRGAMETTMPGHGIYGATRDEFHLKQCFPAVMSAGVAVEPLEQFWLSFAYDREFWHTTKTLVRQYNDPMMSAMGVTRIDARDSDNYHFGFLYRSSEKYEWRAGYTRSGAAVPNDNIIPAQPDYHINYVSAGFSRYAGPIRLDMGVEVGHAQPRESHSQYFPGEYHAKTLNLLAGVAIRVA